MFVPYYRVRQLPGHFEEEYKRRTGKAPSAAVCAQARHELAHAAQRVLLNDPDFVKACREGIVVLCQDGVLRRLFPRLLTYSADYPERLVFPSEASEDITLNGQIESCCLRSAFLASILAPDVWES